MGRVFISNDCDVSGPDLNTTNAGEIDDDTILSVAGVDQADNFCNRPIAIRGSLDLLEKCGDLVEILDSAKPDENGALLLLIPDGIQRDV